MGVITRKNIDERTQWLLNNWENPHGTVAATDGDLRTIAKAQLQCEAFEKALSDKLKKERVVICVTPKGTIKLKISATNNHTSCIPVYSLPSNLSYCVTPNENRWVMVFDDRFNVTADFFSQEDNTEQFTLADQYVADPVTEQKYHALNGIDYMSLGFEKVDNCFMSTFLAQRTRLEQCFRRINPPTPPRGIVNMSLSTEILTLIGSVFGFALTFAKNLDKRVSLIGYLGLGLNYLWNSYVNTRKVDYDSKLADYQVYQKDKKARENALLAKRAHAETSKTHKIIQDGVGMVAFAVVAHVANAMRGDFCSDPTEVTMCKTANMAMYLFTSLTTLTAVFLCYHSLKRSKI